MVAGDKSSLWILQEGCFDLAALLRFCMVFFKLLSHTFFCFLRLEAHTSVSHAQQRAPLGSASSPLLCESIFWVCYLIGRCSKMPLRLRVFCWVPASNPRGCKYTGKLLSSSNSSGGMLGEVLQLTSSGAPAVHPEGSS